MKERAEKKIADEKKMKDIVDELIDTELKAYKEKREKKLAIKNKRRIEDAQMKQK